MAIGIRLSAEQRKEITGEITGKRLREISQEELDKFNDDLVNIASMYGMDSIRSAIEEYQEEILVLVRQVMEEANAPYGGSGSRGAEVCMRALRPIDVGIGNSDTVYEIWDHDSTGITPGTEAEREVTIIDADAMGEADDGGAEKKEGNIIFGALNEHGDERVVNAYRWSKNQVDYPGLTLPFPYVDGDRATFAKFQAPIIQFNEEVLTLYLNTVRKTFSYVALVGIHACRASDVALTYN